MSTTLSCLLHKFLLYFCHPYRQEIKIMYNNLRKLKRAKKET